MECSTALNECGVKYSTYFLYIAIQHIDLNVVHYSAEFAECPSKAIMKEQKPSQSGDPWLGTFQQKNHE